MKRNLIVIWLVSFFSNAIFAHNQQSTANNTTTDLTELTFITEKAKKWSGVNIDSSLKYARSGLLLALELNEHEAMKANLILLGDGYTQLGEYESALEVYNQANKIITTSNNENSTIVLLTGKGRVLNEVGQTAEAIELHQQAKKLASEVGNMELLANSLISLGSIYRKQNKINLALQTQMEALNLTKEHDIKSAISNCLKEIALNYENLGQLDKAIKYYDEILVIASNNDNIRQIAAVLNQLASVYKAGKKTKKSISNAARALTIAEKNNDFENAALACRILERCHRQSKDLKNALKYQQLSDTYVNKLFKIERKHLATALKVNLEFSKKEQENNLLKDKEIMLERFLKWQTLLIIFFCLALILASALALSFYLFNKDKQRSNHFLQKQNKAIKDQKQQLEDVLEQLQQAQFQLVQSEKMASLGQLTAGIAHEINNPVNFIYTGISGLKKNLNALMKIVKKYDKLENKEDVEKTIETIKRLKEDLCYEEILSDIEGLTQSIEDGAKRTGGIVKSLRTFSHVDTTEVNMVDIHQNIDSTLVLLNYQLRYDTQVEKHYAEQLPKVESFGNQLNQVFMNILTNAIQAIGAQKGKISIGTKDIGDSISISISDTGIGIEEDNIKHLFNPFYTTCLLYTSPSPRDATLSRMPSSA